MNSQENNNEIKFPSEEISEKKIISAKKEGNEHLHKQLVKLGDMMGDGLHYEADGKWIAQEYKKVMRALHPEIYQNQRKARAMMIDEQMKKLLLNSKCKCGGILLQARSGSKVSYCVKCNLRYKASSKKKK